MKVQSVVCWYWMDQELTFLKKSIDRRAHDHSSFFLLVTNRVVLTEKKAQKVFRQRLLSVRILKIRLTLMLYFNPWFLTHLRGQNLITTSLIFNLNISYLMCFFEKDIIGGIHPSNDITILVMLTILPSISFFLEEVW